VVIGGVTGKDYTEKPGLHRTLAGDGAGVLFAGLVGGPPITTYSEVTGALTLTKNYNPAIMTWAAVFAVILAFFGKFNALLASIPVPVMGGIMMLMFGSVAAVGLNTLIKARVDLEEPRNLVIVSSVLVMGIGGLALNFDGLTLQGVSLCGVVAVVLNLVLPRVRAGA
jgi:uracil permease